MSIRETKKNYGLITKIVHSIIILLLAFMLITGYWFDDMPTVVKMIHKSTGLVILVLGVFWLVWTILSIKPKTQKPQAPLERLLMLVVHWGLLVVVVLQPITGWIFSTAAGHSPTFYTLFLVSAPVAASKPVASFFHETHNVLAIVILVLIGLHLLGVVKHLVIDRYNILKRMF